jgi:hypothetical protein
MKVNSPSIKPERKMSFLAKTEKVNTGLLEQSFLMTSGYTGQHCFLLRNAKVHQQMSEGVTQKVTQ